MHRNSLIYMNSVDPHLSKINNLGFLQTKFTSNLLNNKGFILLQLTAMGVVFSFFISIFGFDHFALLCCL